MTGISRVHSTTLNFEDELQWGPVVVTGISFSIYSTVRAWSALQWGPVVVTGIRPDEEELRRIAALQWGPVVVTGIRTPLSMPCSKLRCGFNGVRSW